MTLQATKSKGFSHADLGPFQNFLENGPGEKSSKQFLRDGLGLTGMEMSLTAFPAGLTMPFFHSHKQNEELYVIVRGEGKMQLDEQVIDVREGSVIAVKPNTSRCIKASPESELVYICIQAKEGSLEQCTKEDGKRDETTSLLD
jgi:mannose-6-phosphate isomerase-like protein (cupin superfamily)